MFLTLRRLYTSSRDLRFICGALLTAESVDDWLHHLWTSCKLYEQLECWCIVLKFLWASTCSRTDKLDSSLALFLSSCYID